MSVLPSRSAAPRTFSPRRSSRSIPGSRSSSGRIDLSVNKAVAYLWLGGLVTILLGIWIMRFGLSLRPGRRQTTGEAIYDLIQGQIAESSLPSKAISTWFPYVATLFLFIWILNIVGFIPLPLSDEHFSSFGLELPTWGIYAATANLSVTLALALITFAPPTTRASATTARSATSRAGSRPAYRRRLLVLIVPLEVISQFMRLISLSVRLFANMLAGHMLILVMIGLIFIFSSYVIVVIADRGRRTAS